MGLGHGAATAMLFSSDARQFSCRRQPGELPQLRSGCRRSDLCGARSHVQSAAGTADPPRDAAQSPSPARHAPPGVTAALARGGGLRSAPPHLAATIPVLLR